MTTYRDWVDVLPVSLTHAERESAEPKMVFLQQQEQQLIAEGPADTTKLEPGSALKFL